MPVRIAIVGFRHSHILDLYRRGAQMEGVEIVGACEEEPTAREQLETEGEVKITHPTFQDLMADTECDAVAIGDYYGKRGSLAIAALSRGKHVISDKPLCTRTAELDQIEKLAAAHGLRVGCMLNMRDAPPFIGLRDLVRGGVIGEVHAVSFGGQHPLLLGKRAGWYFERGKHGGTINDIGVHAIDAIPWIIGQQFAVINAARSWNAFAVDFPHFQDAGQMMLTMANGCGVLGDVSYFAPDSSGYNLPFYWRTTLWGRRGVLETYSGAKEITIALDGEEGLRSEPVPPGTPGGYLRAFLHDIQGNASEEELNTAVVLRATRTTLRIQEAADQGLREVSLG